MRAGTWAPLAVVPLLLSLAACDRHKAPSDKLAQSASELVGVKKPEPAPLAAGPFAPRDACGDLPGATDFRHKIAAAIAARDIDGFVSLAAEDVKLDFGSGAGQGELRKRLTAKDGMLWAELDKLMTLGCAPNNQGGITIPWYFEQHINKVEPASGMLVTGENVPLLSAPDTTGKPLKALSWDVVDLKALQPDKPFQQVTTTDGVEGYIATDKLRSLLDYRLMATSRNGEWSVVSLVSGD